MSDDKVLVPLSLVKSILANGREGFVSKADADSLRDLLAQPSDGALTNDIKRDQSYRDGLRRGWQFCQDGDDAGYRGCIKRLNYGILEARRGAEALTNEGAEPVVTDNIGGNCWSCKEPVTLMEWVESDGHCPHCDAGIDEAEGIKSAPASISCTCPSGDGSLRWPCLVHPPEVTGVIDPCTWSDGQILDFLGVALRNVDLSGEVKLSEIRQGFEYVRRNACLDRVKELNS